MNDRIDDNLPDSVHRVLPAFFPPGITGNDITFINVFSDKVEHIDKLI